MRAAFITRSNLFRHRGGDTVQAEQTAHALASTGIRADIRRADEKINYREYDLLHFFNLVRPADMIRHIKESRKKYVLSPVFVDYSEYDQQVRRGISGWVLRRQSRYGNEYVKTVLRWLRGSDKLVSHSYLWKGQEACMRYVIRHSSMLLPNSLQEQKAVELFYGSAIPSRVVPNGIQSDLFPYAGGERDDKLILSVARIEGVKNQLNLIRALNHTGFRLLLVGAPSPNQQSYYENCRKLAAPNIQFTGFLPQEKIIPLYRQAAVHVLPSWFETCGLSSLEAGACGCKVVITDKGYTRDYFGDDAFYCDPSDPEDILHTIRLAAAEQETQKLSVKIHQQFTWQAAAKETAAAYEEIVSV